MGKGKNYSAPSPSNNRYSHKPVVYSLNLEGGKKYVSKTNNFEARMSQHFSGGGSKWTQQNRRVLLRCVHAPATERDVPKGRLLGG